MAYGFPYVAIHNNGEVGEKVEETLAMDGPVICEVFVTLEQNFEPKSAAKKLPDGTLVSPASGGFGSFLPDEEMDENMIIPGSRDRPASRPKDRPVAGDPG
mgnify:CR=1 FL=1